MGRPNARLKGPGLLLASAEPGDQLALFREALQELTDRATYLYEEAGRYWFSTQATLNRVADDRAKAWPDHKVDAPIVEVLREDGGQRASFGRLFAAPDDPVAVDETDALSLMILGPAHSQAGKGAVQSAATNATAETLTRCRTSQRRFRNSLVFVAPDEGGPQHGARGDAAGASLALHRRGQPHHRRTGSRGAAHPAHLPAWEPISGHASEQQQPRSGRAALRRIHCLSGLIAPKRSAQGRNLDARHRETVHVGDALEVG